MLTPALTTARHLRIQQMLRKRTRMAGAKVVRLRQAENKRNATGRSLGRQGNDAYRAREHLTACSYIKARTT